MWMDVMSVEPPPASALASAYDGVAVSAFQSAMLPSMQILFVVQAVTETLAFPLLPPWVALPPYVAVTVALPVVVGAKKLTLQLLWVLLAGTLASVHDELFEKDPA